VSAERFTPGGYRFIPGVFQYSAGVAAEPGYAIERVTFSHPVPLIEGFARAAEMLAARGRPLTALCAVELRSPAPLSDEGFKGFNEGYVKILAQWGIYDAQSAINPVARSNVCPELDPPAEPSVYAFSFTVSAPEAGPSFVIAGSGEAREAGSGATYRQRTVRFGETSPAALREKAAFVMGEMERRLGMLGVDWHATSATQVYCVHDIRPFLGELIVGRGAARQGVTWHLCRPPVAGLEFEMDCRGVGIEHRAFAAHR